MNRHFVTWFLLAIAIAFSCSPDNQLNPPQVAPETGGSAASVESFTLAPYGGEWTVVFTGNSSWEMTMSNEGDKWLNVNKRSGRAGTTTLVFSANVNPTRKDRSTQVRFIAKDGSFSETITVSQPYPYLRLVRDEDNPLNPQLNDGQNDFAFTWDHYDKSQMNRTPASIKVESNVEWQVVRMGGGANEYLDTTRTHTGVHFGVSKLQGALEKGVGDAVIDLLPHTQNIDKAPYEVSFQIIPVYKPSETAAYEDIRKIKAEGAASSVDGYSVSLNQNFLRFLIDDKADNMTYVTMSEMNEDITLHINSEVAWKVTDIPGSEPRQPWVKFVETQGNAGDDVLLRFDASGQQSNGVNPERAKRTTRFRLAAKASKGEVGYGAYRDIEVTQKAYVLEFVEAEPSLTESHNFSNDDSAVCGYIVKSSSDNWQLSNVPDWITETRGVRNPADSLTTISFRLKDEVGQNLEESTIQSSGTGVITSDNTLRLDVALSQDPFVFNFSLDEATDGKNLKVKTMDMAYHGAVLVITGDWRLENDSGDWLELLNFKTSITQGARGQFLLEAHPFYGNDNLDVDRKGSLKIVSLNHERRGRTLTRTITLTQSRFVFSVKNKQYFGSTLPAYSPAFVTPSFTVECTVPWTLSVMSSDSNNWLVPSVESYSGTSLEKTVTFTPSVHASESGTRLATVTITPDAAGLNRAVEPKSVYISQSAFSFDESPVSFLDLKEIDVNDLVVTFDNADNAPFTLSKPDWVKYSHSNVNGKSTFTLSVNNNLDTNPVRRSGQVEISSQVNGETKTISLSQDYFKFDNALASLNYEEISQGAQTVGVTCSGGWDVDLSGNNWIHVDKGQNQVSINTEVNSSTASSGRQGTVYVYSVLHKQSGLQLKKAINVTQSPYVFNVSATDLTDFVNRPTSSRTVSVSTSGKWTLKRKDGGAVNDWSGVSATSGNGALGGGNESISVKPANQNDTIPRSVVLRLESEHINLNSALYKEFTLSQQPFVFRLTPKNIVYDGPVHQAARTVNVSCTDAWTIEKKPEWITVNSESGTGGNGSFTFTPENNLQETPRANAVMTVKSTATGHKLDILFSQPAFEHKVDVSKLDFNPVESGTKTFSITSSDDWEVRNVPSWVTITPTNGNGNGSVGVEVEDNTSVDVSKTVQLEVLSSLSGLKRYVTVNQPAFVWVVSGADMTLEPLDVQTRSIAVQSSSSWSVSSSNSSVVAVQKNQDGFTLTPGKNLTQTEQSASLTVRSSYNHSKVIIVTKKPFVWSVSGPLTIALGTPIETPSKQWTVSCSSDWEYALTGDPILSLSKSGNILTASVNINTTSSPRSATLTIRSKEGDYAMDVPITQPAFEWGVTGADAPHFTALSPGIESYSVTCSSSWSVSSSNTDIKVVKGADGFTIEPTENLTLSSRTATVVVKSDKGSYSKSINVTQDAFIWSVTGTNTPQFSALNPGTSSYTVSCTTDWSVSSNNEDIRVVKNAGGFTIEPTENLTLSSRTATVVVKSEKGHTKSINVTQNAFEWNITGPDSLSLTADETKTQQWTVNCSSDWSYQVTGNTEMLTASKPNSSTFQIQVKANTATSSRSATITLSSTVGGHSKVITVNQAGKSQPTE